MDVIGDFVVIKKIKTENRKLAGLEFTEKQDEELRYVLGEVIGAGSLVEWVEVGDTVKFDKMAGHKDELDGSEYHVINCSIRRS